MFFSLFHIMLFSERFDDRVVIDLWNFYKFWCGCRELFIIYSLVELNFCRVNKQVQNYFKSLNNSTKGEEKLSFFIRSPIGFCLCGFKLPLFYHAKVIVFRGKDCRDVWRHLRQPICAVTVRWRHMATRQASNKACLGGLPHWSIHKAFADYKKSELFCC